MSIYIVDTLNMYKRINAFGIGTMMLRFKKVKRDIILANIKIVSRP